MKKKKILLVSFIIILATVINLFAGMISVCAEGAEPTYGGGSGTETDPYKISTADHLRELASYTNGCTESNGDTTKGKYYELQNDIAIGEGTTQADWTPIGIINVNQTTAPTTFKGHFNGNGYTISGFKIDKTTTKNDMVMGLFGAIEKDGCTIKNLRVANATITVEMARNAGAIVGLMNWKSTVSGCSTANDVVIKAIGTHTHDPKLGGIVGYIHEQGVVEYCENNASVIIESTNYSTAYAAGIAGGSAATIKNCVNKGTVTVKAFDGKKTSVYAAGIVGQLNPWTKLVATVENCINYATVTNEAVGTESNIYYASGIVAHVTGTSTSNRVFKNNFNLGKIEAGSVGQIVGAFGSTTSYEFDGNYATKGLGWTFADDDGLGMSGMSTILQSEILANTNYLAAVTALDTKLKFELGAYTLPTGFEEKDPEIPSYDNLFDNEEENEDDNKTNNKKNNTTETTASDNTTEAETVKNEGGCGSTIGLAVFPIVGIIGAIALASKKKEY